MRIDVLREVPDDRLLREQWDELVQHMEEPEVFYTYEWAVSLQRAYGSILRPLLLLGYDQESLIGVAALAVKANDEVGFLAETTADYCDFLSLPAWRRRWCDAVFSELRSLHFGPVCLANVPADSTTASVLSKAAEKHGYRSFMRPGYCCARVVLGGNQDRGSLRHAATGKKAFRRNLRLLGQEGAAVFSANVADEELEPVVTAFCRAHVTRFISTGRLSNMIQPERRIFLQELARLLSTRGWLSINRLLVGDHCVAWNYGFQFGQSWFWYQPTFDTNYEHLSPGLCLLGKVVEAACDSPKIGIVDLGLGAEGYKERFANGNRRTLHIAANSSTVSHAKVVLRYRVAESIKRRPRVESRIRAIVTRLTRLRSLAREGSSRPAVQFLAGLIRDRLREQKEVHFFQWCGKIAGPQDDGLAIREVDMNLLGLAAIEYSDDRETLDYLLRSAQHLREKGRRGFSLVTSSGTPVHFCWVNELLRAPSPESSLIFDSWSPNGRQQRDYFATGAARVAGRLCSRGEVPWIFTAAQNHEFVNGLVQAGFAYKFTIRRRALFGLTDVIETAQPPVTSVATMSSGLRDYVHSEN